MKFRGLKILVSAALAFILIVSFAGGLLASDVPLNNLNLNDEKTITVAYTYPVKPGTEEWGEFGSRMEKIEACHIPESILSKMTTKALVETVMNYPLLIDMVVRDTKQEGFDAILSVFNGLQELVKRPDGLVELYKYQETLESVEYKDIESLLEYGYIDYLIVGMNPNINKIETKSWSTGTVYTPNNTAVSTYNDLTWAEHGLTAYLASVYNSQLVMTYPNATLLRYENPKYNCHSYGWYSTSLSNENWINNPSAYMSDGSYTSGGAVIGSKVWYGAGGHTGIVIGIGGGSNVGVTSKWGAYGLFNHNIVDCPYTKGSYTCTFWN